MLNVRLLVSLLGVMITLTLRGPAQVSSPATVCNDVNGDGVINVVDVQLVAAAINAPGYDPRYDVNEDNQVDSLDLVSVGHAWHSQQGLCTSGSGGVQWDTVSSWTYQLTGYQNDQLNQIAGSNFNLSSQPARLCCPTSRSAPSRVTGQNGRWFRRIFCWAP